MKNEKHRINRFIKKQGLLSEIFIVCILICLAYIFTSDEPELFNYGEEIFNFLYNISLSCIGAILIYYIVDFRDLDHMIEKYERNSLGSLKIINNEMKVMIHLIANKGYENKEIYEEKEITFKIRCSAGENAKKLRFLDKIKDNTTNNSSVKFGDAFAESDERIDKRIDKIILLYSKYLSDDLMDLIISLEDRKMKQRVSSCYTKYNGNSKGWSNIEQKNDNAFEEYVKLQEKLENKIDEILKDI